MTRDASLWDILGIPRPAVIDPAAAEKDREAVTRAMIKQQRLRNFLDRCPTEFRQRIDRDRLPNPEGWDDADKLIPGHYPGAWVWSAATGMCKTRLAWKKFGEAENRLGLRPVLITGKNLYDLFYSTWRDGAPEEFSRFFKAFDFVILDDLDKFPADDQRAANALRQLFDDFYTRHTSVLVTANMGPREFSERIGDSTFRRFCEVCREVCMD